MPKRLIGDCVCNYKGSEPSPKCNGWCAHCLETGFSQTGCDNSRWVIKKRSTGSKYWTRKSTGTKTKSKRRRSIKKSKKSRSKRRKSRVIRKSRVKTRGGMQKRKFVLAKDKYCVEDDSRFFDDGDKLSKGEKNWLKKWKIYKKKHNIKPLLVKDVENWYIGKSVKLWTWGFIMGELSDEVIGKVTEIDYNEKEGTLHVTVDGNKGKHEFAHIEMYAMCGKMASGSGAFQVYQGKSPPKSLQLSEF